MLDVVRFWWLKLKALAEKGDWEELEKFAKSKKSPIGYLVNDALSVLKGLTHRTAIFLKIKCIVCMTVHTPVVSLLKISLHHAYSLTLNYMEFVIHSVQRPVAY